MRANTHHESLMDTLRRVDWYAFTGLWIVAFCAFCTGYILVALGMFVWRQWL